MAPGDRWDMLYALCFKLRAQWYEEFIHGKGKRNEVARLYDQSSLLYQYLYETGTPVQVYRSLGQNHPSDHLTYLYIPGM